MNLHLFEVVLLIHANETLHKGDGVEFEGGGGPSKRRDCLILLSPYLSCGNYIVVRASSCRCGPHCLSPRGTTGPV